MGTGAAVLAAGVLWEHAELLALEAEFALGVVDRDLVVPAPAGGAVVLLGALEAREHAVEREVGEAVDLEERRDLLDAAVVGDQLFARREVDAVEAGVADRRAGDAQVDLLRAGAADRAHL